MFSFSKPALALLAIGALPTGEFNAFRRSFKEQPANVYVMARALEGWWHEITVDGALIGVTLVLDARPAVDFRFAPPSRQQDPRPIAVTRTLAAAFGALPATEAEMCVVGSNDCKVPEHLGIVVVGEPIQSGETLAVLIGMTRLFDTGVELVPVTHWWQVSLRKELKGWNPMSIVMLR